MVIGEWLPAAVVVAVIGVLAFSFGRAHGWQQGVKAASDLWDDVKAGRESKRVHDLIRRRDEFREAGGKPDSPDYPRREEPPQWLG
jgi:hypothetical protein